MFFSKLEELIYNLVNYDVNGISHWWEVTKTSITNLFLVDIASAFYLACFILLAIWFYKLNSYDVKELLKEHAYEVHLTAGDLGATYGSTKRCILILNELPFLVNQPKPPYNYTPFLRACWSGNMPLVNYMLKYGADIYSRTLTNETPVYLAAYRVTKSSQWDPSVLGLLYTAGCELNIMTVHGYSALHLAAYAGHVTLARWLLDRKAHHGLPCTPNSPYQIALKMGERNHICIAALLHVFCPDMVSRVNKYKIRYMKRN